MKNAFNITPIINLFIILLMASSVSAGTCLNNNCHQSLTTPKHLHGPIAAEMAGADGCMTCHQPSGKPCTTETAGKFMFTKEDKEMCLLCHGRDVATEHTKKEKTCLRCHDPHGSEDNYNFLRKDK